MKDLQKEFEKQFGYISRDKYGDGFEVNCTDELYKWIQDNYVSKDKVRGLKRDNYECPDDKLDNEYVTEWYRGSNQIIEEFNNSIDEITK